MLKRLYIWLVALYPIISGYGFSPSLDFGSILLFLIGILAFAAHPKSMRFKLPNGYYLFFCFALFFTMVFAHTLPLRLILFSVNLIIACSLVEFDYLKNIYYKIVVVSVVFFLVQEFTYLSTGVRISGIVPFIPTIYGGEYGLTLADVDRSAVFFLEPSYFAQFLFPYIILNLFYEGNKDIWKAVAVSVIVLLSQSGMGALLLVVIWFIWFMIANINLCAKIGFTTIAVFLLFVLSYYNPTILSNLIERSSELNSFSGDEPFQSSGFIRFFRGYYAYGDMPLFNKIFGANPEFVKSVVQNNIFFYNSEDESFNGVTTLLLYNGIIVTFLYLHHIILFSWRKKNVVLFSFVLCCILLLFGESFYLCSRMFLCTVIMYQIGRRSKVKMVSKINKIGAEI